MRHHAVMIGWAAAMWVGLSIPVMVGAAPAAPLATATRPALQAASRPATQPAALSPEERLRRRLSPFDDNVKVTFDDQFMVVESDGIPTHQVGDFPNRGNPNAIRKQNYVFRIPLRPRSRSDGKNTPTPMGPIGVAINGVPFYNPYNAEGNDAVMGPFAEVFDSCCGHPDQLGRYHYHQYPVCVKSPFRDPAGEHSPLIGFAFDGYAVYGPLGEDGKPPSDLDDCNGHSDARRGYHYHVSSKFPYIVGAYRGQVDRANFDQRGRFAGGREPGGDGRPRGPHPQGRPPRPPRPER